jgi:hypothetical protein
MTCGPRSQPSARRSPNFDEAADTSALAAMADRDAACVRGAINAINKTQTVLRETQPSGARSLPRHTGPEETRAECSRFSRFSKN